MSENMETFKSTGKGDGWPTKVSIIGAEWKMQVDEPVEDGGKNSGPNPMHYFSASLVSCQNEQAQVVAEELSLNIGKIDITVEIDLNLSGFMGTQTHSKGCYTEVRLNAVVLGDVTKDQAQELGKKVDDRCPILELLRASGCKIISSWSIQ